MYNMHMMFNRYVEPGAHLKRLLFKLGLKSAITVVYWDPNFADGMGREFEV